MFQKGQTVNVMILEVKKDERKMLLGYKQTIENPWDKISQSFPVGSVHKSKIKKIVKFGLFVELENDIDGLVHISDISWEDGKNDSTKKYSVGDEVEFKILDGQKG